MCSHQGKGLFERNGIGRNRLKEVDHCNQAMRVQNSRLCQSLWAWVQDVALNHFSSNMPATPATMFLTTVTMDSDPGAVSQPQLNPVQNHGALQWLLLVRSESW